MGVISHGGGMRATPMHIYITVKVKGLFQMIVTAFLMFQNLSWVQWRPVNNLKEKWNVNCLLHAGSFY